MMENYLYISKYGKLMLFDATLGFGFVIGGFMEEDGTFILSMI